MKINKSFFATTSMPVIDLTKEQLQELAEQSVNNRFTITGVQKKLSLNLERGRANRLTLINYPAGYILKPQTDEYKHMPEAEDVAMDIAASAGIKVVPHGLIKLDGEWAYITKRIDRRFDKDHADKLAMEDLCQLSGRMTEDKYKGSYEKCVEIIKQYSWRSGYDCTEFFMRVLISYLIGNSDMHLKNFSLIETEPGNREFVLTPAYDMLPVKLFLTGDDEDLALTLNGKKSRFRRRDFLLLAEKCGINEKTANRIIDTTFSRMDKYMKIIVNSELPIDMQDAMISLMRKRIEQC